MQYSENDKRYIKGEIGNLLKEGVTEPSMLAWRTQGLEIGEGSHGKRLLIGYSRTINKFIELDEYPLPNIETLVTKIAHKIYLVKSISRLLTITSVKRETLYSI